MLKDVELSPDTETALAEFAGQFYSDPYGFVMAAYPWGEPTLPDGTFNRLHDKDGPEQWQKEFLIDLGKHIRRNLEWRSVGLWQKTWRSAIASGHDTGKSTLVVWLIHFFMTTRRDTRGVVTAGTQRQLESKTWPELAVWHKGFLFKHWFQWTATTYYFSPYPEDQRKTYMFEALTVAKDNSEAFQGLHNASGTVVVIFDEASGIEEPIWKAARGVLFDGEAFFFAKGNPTKPDGEFANCFDKNKELYYTRHIDTRSARLANPQEIIDLIKEYGGDEDSDEIRIRVRGLFPRQAYNGFITTDIVDEAQNRELWYDSGAALILAVDVARYGRDSTIFQFRQGRDARSRPRHQFHGLSTVEVSDRLMKVIDATRPDAVVVESLGPGAGVIDMCRSRGYRIVEVHPGAPSSMPMRCANKRAEMWLAMREWLVDEGCIDMNAPLYAALTKMQYSLERHKGAYLIEGKEDYKVRTGLPSPDEADALALTFGTRVQRRDTAKFFAAKPTSRSAEHEYDPMTY